MYPSRETAIYPGHYAAQIEFISDGTQWVGLLCTGNAFTRNTGRPAQMTCTIQTIGSLQRLTISDGHPSTRQTSHWLTTAEAMTAARRWAARRYYTVGRYATDPATPSM